MKKRSLNHCYACGCRIPVKQGDLCKECFNVYRKPVYVERKVRNHDELDKENRIGSRMGR